MASHDSVESIIVSKYIRGSLGMRDIADKIQEARLRWFGHVLRKPHGYVGNTCHYPERDHAEGPKSDGLILLSRKREDYGVRMLKIVRNGGKQLRKRTLAGWHKPGTR